MLRSLHRAEVTRRSARKKLLPAIRFPPPWAAFELHVYCTCGTGAPAANTAKLRCAGKRNTRVNAMGTPFFPCSAGTARPPTGFGLSGKSRPKPNPRSCASRRRSCGASSAQLNCTDSVCPGPGLRPPAVTQALGEGPKTRTPRALRSSIALSDCSTTAHGMTPKNLTPKCGQEGQVTRPGYGTTWVILICFSTPPGLIRSPTPTAELIILPAVAHQVAPGTGR